MNRLLSTLPPMRWWRALRAMTSLARVHPNAILFGRPTQVVLSKGCKLGARVRIDPGSQGLVKINKNAWISTDVEIQTNSQIFIGNGTTIQRRCTINGSTKLGSGCILAPNVFISSGTHHFQVYPHLPIRTQEKIISEGRSPIKSIDRPVWIQDDCWLGTNTVVSPGITIGKGSIIGANSVVTRNIPPYSIAAGNPARLIKKRLEWQPPLQINPNSLEDHPYLLEACLSHQTNEISIEINIDTPLLAALSPSDPNVYVLASWKSKDSVVLECGKQEVKLSPGQGVIKFPPQNFQISSDSLIIDIRLSPNSPKSSKVNITHLKLSQSDPLNTSKILSTCTEARN